MMKMKTTADGHTEGVCGNIVSYWEYLETSNTQKEYLKA